MHSVGVQHERGVRDVVLPGSLGQYFENEYIVFKNIFVITLKIFFPTCDNERPSCSTDQIASAMVSDLQDFMGPLSLYLRPWNNNCLKKHNFIDR